MVLSEDSILVDGHVELRVVEEFFDTELPGKPTDTVNLWILSHTERIPCQDERFMLDGLQIHVKNASERRIRQVVLTRPPEQPTRELHESEEQD
jgi:CBS domain containing-hemolysin-like protein